MAETLKVAAVPGRALPCPGKPGAFVGMKRAPADTPEPDLTHRVPGGYSYVSAGDVDVPNDRYHRRALRVGDLATAKPARKARKE